MMKRNLALPKRRHTDRSSWHGQAFILEALALLIFLILSLAVLMQTFSAAYSHEDQADSLSFAVILASNEAERFAINPTSSVNDQAYNIVDGTIEVAQGRDNNTLVVSRSVTPQTMSNGIYYVANIEVAQNEEIVYKLSTAKYVSYPEVS